MLEIRVLTWSRYDFADKTTGAQLKGCKVTYIQPAMCQSKEDKGGWDVNTSTMDYKVGSLLENIPAEDWYFQAGFEVVQKGNVASVQLTHLNHVPKKSEGATK